MAIQKVSRKAISHVLQHVVVPRSTERGRFNVLAQFATAAATADEAAKVREGMVIVRGSPPARGGVDAFRGRGGGSDGIVKNKYANNPGKLAAWLSASHVEKLAETISATITG